MTIMQLAGFPAEVVEFGRLGAGAHGLRLRPVERRRVPAARGVRGSAPLHAGRPPRLRADPQGAVAHRQGRPQVRLFLGVVTQRPGELDATIMSQCSTVFAMRMANDRDQAIIRSAVSDAAGSLLAFVPSLGTREVFAFGEGVALPTRLRFKQLDRAAHPAYPGLHRATMDCAARRRCRFPRLCGGSAGAARPSAAQKLAPTRAAQWRARTIPDSTRSRGSEFTRR